MTTDELLARADGWLADEYADVKGFGVTLALVRDLAAALRRSEMAVADRQSCIDSACERAEEAEAHAERAEAALADWQNDPRTKMMDAEIAGAMDDKARAEAALAQMTFERNNLAMRVEQLEEDTALSERFELINQREVLQRELAEAREVLEFYGDPDIYIAIAFLSDPPCGEFMDDFDEQENAAGNVRPMPGKRARAFLAGQEEP